MVHQGIFDYAKVGPSVSDTASECFLASVEQVLKEALLRCVGVAVGVVRVGFAPGPLLRLRVVPANEALSERRRRDSNPRYPVERYNTLAGCRLQPLGHSSGSQEYIKDVLRLRALASEPSPILS
jgi:hypothetical protein